MFLVRCSFLLSVDQTGTYALLSETMWSGRSDRNASSCKQLSKLHIHPTKDLFAKRLSHLNFFITFSSHFFFSCFVSFLLNESLSATSTSKTIKTLSVSFLAKITNKSQALSSGVDDHESHTMRTNFGLDLIESVKLSKPSTKKIIFLLVFLYFIGTKHEL